MTSHRTLVRAGIALLALQWASLAPAAAQSSPAPCGQSAPTEFSLVAPSAGSPAVPVDFKTIYVRDAGPPAATLPPLPQSRILLVEDSGAVTEGGVLHPTTADGLPYALQSADGVAAPTRAPFTTFAYTWVPGLRAATHYTALLARLDQNNCTFARLGTFTTASGV